jgi:type I restriction enzyme S subunit
MSKVKKNIVPKLRFPEFIKVGNWKELTLGDLCHYWNGIGHERGIDENGGYYLISLNSIDIDGNLKSDMKRLSYTDNSLQKNDLVMVLSDVAHGNFLGLTDIIPNNQFVLNQRMAGLRAKDISSLNLFFLRTFINYNQKYFKEKGQGSSQLNLSKSAVTEFPVLLPEEITEQKKIAACLSSLDDLITAHNQKLEALKAHKKGLMQQLFPAEGETVPKLRFKGFSGEWVEKTFGDAATFINGRAYKQEELLSAGKYRVLRVGNFFTNNEWYYSDLELDEDKYCDDGDLLYAWSASFGPRIWKGEKVIYHYHIWKVIEKESVDKNFLFILLDYETQRMKSQSANGFALLHITKGTIEGWKCRFPKSRKEQQEIASCLSSLDELITAQAEKIEELKKHKKGLMQQLFPNINE